MHIYECRIRFGINERDVQMYHRHDASLAYKFQFLNYFLGWSSGTSSLQAKSVTGSVFSRNTFSVFYFFILDSIEKFRAIFNPGRRSGPTFGTRTWRAIRKIEFLKSKFKPRGWHIEPTQAKKWIFFKFRISNACFFPVSFDYIISGLPFALSKHKRFLRTPVIVRRNRTTHYEVELRESTRSIREAFHYIMFTTNSLSLCCHSNSRRSVRQFRTYYVSLFHFPSASKFDTEVTHHDRIYEFNDASWCLKLNIEIFNLIVITRFDGGEYFDNLEGFIRIS